MWFCFGHYVSFCSICFHFSRFGGFVSVVLVVSVVSFRSFRFVVSGFSTCPPTQSGSSNDVIVNKVKK